MIDYPQAAQAPAENRPPVPASLRNAVRAMYAGAAVAVAHAVSYLVTVSALKTAIRQKHPTLSVSGLNTAANVAVIIGTVAAFVAALCFIWIARSCLAGKNWARITGTVFFAISVVVTVYNLSSPGTTVSQVLVLIENLAGLTAVVLLWQGASSAYFRFFKRPEF